MSLKELARLLKCRLPKRVEEIEIKTSKVRIELVRIKKSKTIVETSTSPVSNTDQSFPPAFDHPIYTSIRIQECVELVKSVNHGFAWIDLSSDVHNTTLIYFCLFVSEVDRIIYMPPSRQYLTQTKV